MTPLLAEFLETSTKRLDELKKEFVKQKSESVASIAQLLSREQAATRSAAELIQDQFCLRQTILRNESVTATLHNQLQLAERSIRQEAVEQRRSLEDLRSEFAAEHVAQGQSLLPSENIIEAALSNLRERADRDQAMIQQKELQKMLIYG